MTQESRPFLAAAWMIGAIFAFSSMAVGGRAIADELDTFELMMYRSFIGLFVIVTFGVLSGKLHEARTNRIGLHIIRNASHFTGQNLWFYALTLIPLAPLFALEFTSPIWVVILATLFLGERLTRMRTLAVALGFIGALIVARPGAGGDPLGLALAAGSAIGFAGSIVCTKMLTRTETIVGILFWLTFLQAIMGIVATSWDGDVAWPSTAAWPWVVMVGLAGLVAHTCLTNALKVAPATVVTPMDFIRLPAIAVVGMLFYNEPLDAFVLIGALLIFGGNYLNIWAESRKANA